eukprot:SAG31_NODE_1096_length_9920_cov_14.794216_11_plen_257_part_00
MYAGLYGAGALGLLPTAGLRRADRLVVQLGTRARVLHRRDPTLLGPLVDQVEKICDGEPLAFRCANLRLLNKCALVTFVPSNPKPFVSKDVLEEGAPATFSELVCLLEALDYRSRGDSGWANVQDRTDGGIVSEFSGVMMAAAACVLICMFNMGAVGAHGSAQRTAFATALAMRENLSSDGEESELYTDMATRLDALEAAVEAGEHGPGYGKAGLEQYEAVQEAKLKCGLDELVSAYNGFVETYAEDVADYPSDDD